MDAHSTTAKVGVVKNGQDVHAAQVTVVVQLRGSVNRRAQVIRIDQYLGWVRVLKARYPEAEFHSCARCIESLKPRSLDSRRRMTA